MIVPMKKVTLLALSGCEAETLEQLRDLGVMQITGTPRASEEFQQLAGRIEEAQKIRRRLAAFAEKSAAEPVASDGADALRRAGQLLAQFDAHKNEAALCARRIEQLAVWGEFDCDALAALAERGVNCVLCTGSEAEYQSACGLENAAVELIARSSHRVSFAVVSTQPLPETLPAVKFAPGDDLRELRRHAAALNAAMAEEERTLAQLAGSLPAMHRAAGELAAAAEFRRVLDTAAPHEVVISLQGFVPEPEIGKLRSAAHANGWGLNVEDPAPGEEVPVLVRESNFARLIKPLFDFLGVLPGYSELDVSGGVLIFFTIFYAMIVGDAGYGSLFFLLTLLASLKFRHNPKAKPVLRLALILSAATILWGGLSGCWFGISYGGIAALTDPAVKDANIQAWCFLLAVAQLSLGHLWRAIHRGDWRSIGSNLGWMLILWGNFILTLRIIVWPGAFPKFMFAFYGVGLALVMICGLNWRDPAALFQLPFDVIGSFTDILSYIRLFAVGMAGSCIAASFNGMAMDIFRASPWFILFGVLALLAGHLLNLGLGVLSVLVHAVRLNTLEFSNHAGLTWSGNQYHAFKKTNLEEK